MIPIISFSDFLCTAKLAILTWVVSLTMNMARCLTLRWVISRSAVAINFEPCLDTSSCISNFDWLTMSFPIFRGQITINIELHKVIDLLNDILDSLELFQDTCMGWGWDKMCVSLLVEKPLGQILVSDIEIPVLIPTFWAVPRIVFEGLVARTEKVTETRLNATKCNWTTGCSCFVLASVGISWVAGCLKYENCKKTARKLVAIGCKWFFCSYVCIIYYLNNYYKAKPIMRLWSCGWMVKTIVPNKTFIYNQPEVKYTQHTASTFTIWQNPGIWAIAKHMWRFHQKRQHHQRMQHQRKPQLYNITARIVREVESR